MIKNRRDFLNLSISLFTSSVMSRSAIAQPNQFSADLEKALSDETALEGSRDYRERQIDEFDFYASRAIAPRRQPSERKISSDAENMIVLFEVSSKAIYEMKYRKPIWPHGASGVTFGIGYDAGYVTAEWLKEDWSEHLSSDEITTLLPVCRVTGPEARALVSTVSSVNIPWDKAYDQFRRFVLQRYVSETLAALPNASQLSDDSLGALVSLVYNRGASFKKLTERYKEMRAIHYHMARKDYAQIPNELRAMKQIWANDPKMKGLLVRRDLEASLFERGLK